MRFIKTYRVAIFTPTYQVAQLLEAVQKVTDLSYGNYVGVSWTSSIGDERFTPIEGASPTLGDLHQEQIVQLSRVEFSLPRDDQLLRTVIERAIYPNHDWEEPVISVTEALDTRQN